MTDERHLVLAVRLHGDGQGTARFHGMAHGAPEWPPSPARLFQALIAGVARGGTLPREVISALEWLERLPPPVIAAPARRTGQQVNLFVPNNDADAVDDPRDVSGIRTKKLVQPSLFSEAQPLIYAWALPGDTAHSEVIASAAAELYQLGRGVDMAWAVGEILDGATLDERLAAHRGVIHRPEAGSSDGRALACPVAGSLASLVARHRAVKLRVDGAGKSARTLFSNPPKPRFRSVSYERATSRLIYQLRERDEDKPWPWALGRVVKLVETLRDGAAARLRQGLPDHHAEIERALIGRKSDGADAGPIGERVRIVPLPSIGAEHADHAIRRFLLDIPSGAPLPAGDLEWAFAGLDAAAVDGPSSLVVVRGDVRGDDDMLRHYRGPSRRWRSQTAVALPDAARRRRIEPARQHEEAKPALERRTEEDRAVAAVHVALRHAGVSAIATAVRVQREPFEARGKRAEVFADDTRFAKERLWHVELELDRQVVGPLVIGDGRFLGLGVMAPVPRTRVIAQLRSPRAAGLLPARGASMLALQVDGEVRDAPVDLARALRRAVMARVQTELGNRPLDRYFSGHEPDGAKAESVRASHLAFQWDRVQRRLLVIAPHALDRRPPTAPERRNFERLERALDGFAELRAGYAGRFGVHLASLGADDLLLAPARRWTTITPYAVTRHARRASAAAALTEDVLAQCAGGGLPRPAVTVLDARGVAGRGLEGHLQLDFAVAIAGPLVLGRTRYLGGGLFSGAP